MNTKLLSVKPQKEKQEQEQASTITPSPGSSIESTITI